MSLVVALQPMLHFFRCSQTIGNIIFKKLATSLVLPCPSNKERATIWTWRRLTFLDRNSGMAPEVYGDFRVPKRLSRLTDLVMKVCMSANSSDAMASVTFRFRTMRLEFRPRLVPGTERKGIQIFRFSIPMGN